MAQQRNKKVLIITYYWPPAGGPGVQRVLKFVKYLPKYGWEPIVMTVRDGEYPAIDPSLQEQLASDTIIYKTRSIEPFGLYKRIIGKKKEHKIDTYILNQKSKGLLSGLMKWIRLNIFIPDARIGWYFFAISKGKKIIKEEKIDLIYTCSPPHSLQLIGLSLSKKSGIPWVADFRDPWMSLVSYQGQSRSKMTRSIDAWFERSVLSRASKIVVTCNGLKTAFAENQNIESEKVVVITNGYEIVKKTSPRVKNTDDTLVIFYGGNLSNVRLPVALLDAMESVKAHKLDRQVKFRIAGQVSEEFWCMVESKGLEKEVDYLGYISHDEVLRQHRASNMLLQVVDDVPSNHLFISGKLFDYLGSMIPILAIGPKNGEVHQIIEDTNSGYFFDYKESEAMTELLKQILKGQIDLQKKFDFRGIEKYSRRELTKNLAEIFNGLNSK